jgi:hypothetical protein
MILFKYPFLWIQALSQDGFIVENKKELGCLEYIFCESSVQVILLLLLTLPLLLLLRILMLI